ncbi:helix-turn-helix transcriptional regulator [Aquipuribacter nitratireducens]|uniref:AAA family ATPase n=1 Tax=Aquipuribacter nitratireducens TaxID=650104 RepID=A0ABW0GKA7_9MICO
MPEAGQTPGGPLVGRDEELATLRDALVAASGHDGRVALVTGPAGVGKTTLVTAACRDTRRPVAVGRCAADTAAVPLWPWRRAAHGTPAATVLERLAREESTGAGAGGLASEHLARTAEAADAVAEGIDGGTVVVLEDLHWADAWSTELLGHLGVHASGGPTLVATSRRPPVAAGLADLLRVPTTCHVPLAGLGVEAVAAYLAATEGREVTPARVAEVTAATGGLPWLLAATVGRDPGRARADVAAAALAGLDAAQRDVLTTAAVLGEVLDLDLLTAVTGRSRAEVAGALSLARGAGVVRDGRFVHDLVREVVAEHARADPADLCLAAAEHVLASGDPARSLTWWVRSPPAASVRRRGAGAAADAARAAVLRGTLDDARRLLDGWSGDPAVSGEPALLADLCLLQAEVAFGAGAIGACLEHLARAAEAAVATAPPDRAGLLARTALTCWGVGYPQARDAVIGFCELALAEEQPADVRARLVAQLAAAVADVPDLPRARALTVQAVALARASGDDRALLDAARAEEITLVEAGDCGAARWDVATRAVAAASRLGLVLPLVIAHGWQLTASLELARPAAAEDAVTAMEGIGRRHGGYPRWHACRAGAALAAMRGRFAEGAALNAAALEAVPAAHDPVANGLAHQLGLHMAWVSGDVSWLLPTTEATLAEHPAIPVVLVARAVLAHLRGERSTAAQIVAQLVALPPEELWDERGRAVAFHLAQLVCEAGEPEQVRWMLAVLDGFREHDGVIGVHTAHVVGSPRRVIGLLHARQGEHVAAEQHLRAALAADSAMSAAPFVVHDLLGLAEVAAATGRGGEAAALASRAARGARALGMPGPGKRARRLLGTGEPAGAGSPLTPREREVMALVRRGSSNHEIASRLYLSERTVETHVSNLLRKLGHANRRELLVADGPGPHEQGPAGSGPV